MIWLIGNKGMLGTDVEKFLIKNHLLYTSTDTEVDITSKSNLSEYASTFFHKDNFNWIINCAAYTAVDKAEDESEKADKINNIGVKNIAECALENNAKMIHISTDYVFDGKNPELLTEDMQTEPIGVYGQTKFAGEKAIREVLDKYFIIRTAWLYGLSGQNFVYTMLKLMNDRDSITVVNDQHGTPTKSEDLAGLIIEIIKRESDAYGIYHYTNEGNITWYDFAMEIYMLGRKKGLITSECAIQPCHSDEFVTKAKRPEYSLLSKDKVKKTFEIDVPKWQESLAGFINKLEEIK